MPLEGIVDLAKINPCRCGYALTFAMRNGYQQRMKSILPEQLQRWIVRYLPALMFLGCYLLTTVIGNVLYTADWAVNYLDEYSIPIRFLTFPETFSAGYWLLLGLPLFITPPTIWLVRKISMRHVEKRTAKIQDVSFQQFLVVAIIILGMSLYHFTDPQIWRLFFSSHNFSSAVEARFAILDRLGFFQITLLQSILPYLAFYACIRALREGQRHWRVAAIALVVAVALLSIILNMKWPVLLFFIGVVLCIFCDTRRRPYLKTILGGVFLVILYLGISALVLRVDVQASKPHDEQNQKYQQIPKEAANAVPLNKSTKSIVNLLFLPINRMAAGYPYYYHVFTTEGAACGGLIDQMRRDPPCRPSTYIYTKIFGNDGFEGRGTTPQAVHISAYALGGWPLAVLALAATSIILGLLCALPSNASATVKALFISGALTGYHFSQVPGEGAIFYPHGLAWAIVIATIFTILGQKKTHQG